MLPQTWTKPDADRVSVSSSLDSQFAEKAKQCGISLAKLKTVYFRGVDEFHASNYDMGTPAMWGLARVQRFINAVTAGEPVPTDADLLECDDYPCLTDGVDMPLSASMITAEVFYSAGDRVAELFQPGTVTAMTIEDSSLFVSGDLDGALWEYRLDMLTGDDDFRLL